MLGLPLKYSESIHDGSAIWSTIVFIIAVCIFCLLTSEWVQLHQGSVITLPDDIILGDSAIDTGTPCLSFMTHTDRLQWQQQQQQQQQEQ